MMTATATIHAAPISTTNISPNAVVLSIFIVSYPARVDKMLWQRIVASMDRNVNELKDLTVKYKDVAADGTSTYATPHQSPIKTGVKQHIQVTMANDEQKYSNAAFIIFVGTNIVNDEHGKVLLLKLDYGSKKWATPGGKKEGNEGALQTALRETREETGLYIDMNNVNDVWTMMYEPTDTKLFIIIIDELPGDVTLSKEHSAWKLVEWDRIINGELTDYAAGAFAMIRDKIGKKHE
jgi:8-oxo-dGTP pyrophosphatase MutT (NUDIX family)